MAEILRGLRGQERGQRNAVQMPSLPEMTRSLNARNFFEGLPAGPTKFYDVFVKEIAKGKGPQTGSDLNAAWASAAYTIASGDLTIASSMLTLPKFDTIVDTVTPDPTVAAQAKKTHRTVATAIGLMGIRSVLFPS